MITYLCPPVDLSSQEQEVVDMAIEEAKEILGEGTGSPFSVAVRMFRAARKMKLGDLALEAQVSREVVWDIERGQLQDIEDERVKRVMTIVNMKQG